MKVIFRYAGFRIPALTAIMKYHQVVGCVCQPDKIGSRGKIEFCAVKNSLWNIIYLYTNSKNFARRSRRFEKFVAGYYGNGGLRANSFSGSNRYSSSRDNKYSRFVVARAQRRFAHTIRSSFGVENYWNNYFKTVRKVDAGEIILQNRLI